MALVAREVLDDHGLTAWPKTSGSRGFHIYARIHPQWPFKQVRLAAETVAREVERRAPDLATARWWKEERGERVFVDFNQNAKDRTVASAYSVRATPDARVSTPLLWDEVARLPARGVHHRHRARAIRRASATRGGHGRRAGWSGTAARRWPRSWARRRSRRSRPTATGAAQSTMPLIEVARTKTRSEATGGPGRWRGRYPAVAGQLAPVDVLVDGMRGPSSIWYRVRINLQHVPEDRTSRSGTVDRRLFTVGRVHRRAVSTLRTFWGYSRVICRQLLKDSYVQRNPLRRNAVRNSQQTLTGASAIVLSKVLMATPRYLKFGR